MLDILANLCLGLSEFLLIFSYCKYFMGDMIGEEHILSKHFDHPEYLLLETSNICCISLYFRLDLAEHLFD